MIEKRFYPRVQKQFAVVVENEQGVHLDVVAVDASSEGLCIQCNTSERNQITPGGSFVFHGKPVELYVWLNLPFDNGKSEKVGTKCHVSFSRRISSDQCKIGMRYMDLDKKQYEKLVRYLALINASNDRLV